MNITAIRVRRLISLPGYENCAVEVESAVNGEPPEVVRQQLSDWADDQLAAMKGDRELRRRGEVLACEVGRLEQQKRELTRQVVAGNALIRKHNEIRAIAEQHGLPRSMFESLGDEIPF